MRYAVQRGIFAPEVTVDYADVLRQAVRNERVRVLLDLRSKVTGIRTEVYDHGQHGQKAKSATLDFIDSALRNAETT